MQMTSPTVSEKQVRTHFLAEKNKESLRFFRLKGSRFRHALKKAWFGLEIKNSNSFNNICIKFLIIQVTGFQHDCKFISHV